jgi:DNA-binding CsgD family transcriptional regulator
VSGSSFWQILVYAVPSLIGALLCLVYLVVLLRKPTWPLFFFLCFYAISVFHLAGAFITYLISRGPGRWGIRQLWDVSLVISRLRYVPLILFVHTAHRFRLTRVLTVILILIVAAGAASPFFFYSIIPNLVEIAVVLYAFLYWMIVYLMRNRLSIPVARQGFLRAVLACSGFFLTGIILDLLEDMPLASLYVSILLVEFYPAYLVCIGAVMAYWVVRDLVRPPISRGVEQPGRIDLSGLRVTKREGEIVGLILGGETNATIAGRLFISESTVKKHINNLFRKLGITSRWELLKLTGNLHPKE